MNQQETLGGATGARSAIGTTDSAWLGRVRLAEADARPGRYYVTCKNDHGKTAYLLGPFTQHGYGKTGHARANGRLRAAKHYISENYPNSAWWTFGTAWLPLHGTAPVGKLNAILEPAGVARVQTCK